MRGYAPFPHRSDIKINKTTRIATWVARLDVVCEASAGDLNLLGRLVHMQPLVVLHRGAVVERRISLHHGYHHPTVFGVEIDPARASVDRDDL